MAAGSETINIFPWVPFFKGALGFWVGFVTILALPVIANTFLLYRFGHWAEWSTKIGIACDLLILGTGTWAIYEVSRLRKQSFGQGASTSQ